VVVSGIEASSHKPATVLDLPHFFSSAVELFVRCRPNAAMAKRKRESLEAAKNGLTSLDRQRKSVGEQIELGKKALVRNLKLAKGFERQKLGRRQKDALAKNDTAANARIEAEIDALKVCANIHSKLLVTI